MPAQDRQVSVSFLKGTDIERKAQELISKASRVQLAVAYWGAGSSNWLVNQGLANKDVLIICDLLSGACNPGVIKKLQEALGVDRVLTRDGLHAKVWLTNNAAIVGSSNMSANGLGFEGDELRGQIEANIFVTEPYVLEEIDTWFREDVVPGARKIGRQELAEATERWKRHRNARRMLSSGKTVIDEIRTNPSIFADRDILVWIYEQPDLDAWAKKRLKKEQREREDSSIDCWQDVDRPLSPGAYIVDFPATLGRNGQARATYNGLYQVLKDTPFVKTKEGNLLLCRRVKNIEGLSLGKRGIWSAAATAAKRSNPSTDEWTIEDFAEFF